MPPLTMLTEHELAILAEEYILANTPVSLYRRLSANAAVRRLATDATTEDLVALLRTAIQKQPKTELDAAQAYAAFVALVLRSLKGAGAQLLPVEPHVLTWGPRIWSYARHTYLPTNLILLDASGAHSPTASVSSSEVAPTRIPTSDRPIIILPPGRN